MRSILALLAILFASVAVIVVTVHRPLSTIDQVISGAKVKRNGTVEVSSVYQACSDKKLMSSITEEALQWVPPVTAPPEVLSAKNSSLSSMRMNTPVTAPAAYPLAVSRYRSNSGNDITGGAALSVPKL